MDQQGLKAVIIGASGAVGRELVAELTNSPKWSEVAVIVRRKLEQWDTLPNKQKLKITQVENLDCLEQTEIWNFQKYNSFFCVLGSRVKEGDALFKKVDYHYPVFGAKIAKLNEIPHYSILTSVGADKKSMFLYTRVKGEVEEAIQSEKFPFTSIHRAGAILNRQNDDRFGEAILKYIPFIGKIDSKDLAKAIRIDAEKAHEEGQQGQQNINKVVINDNTMLLNLLK